MGRIIFGVGQLETGVGAFTYQVRTTDSLPAVFTSVGARNTYYTTNAGDLAELDSDKSLAVGVGTVDGDPTSVTEVYTRRNGQWVTAPSTFKGDKGDKGDTGATGSARPEVEITSNASDTEINTTTIATYRNNDIINRVSSGNTNVNLGTITSFITANPSDEFTLYFINESAGDFIVNAGAGDAFAGISGPLTMGPGESCAIKLPSGGGTRWSLIRDTIATAGGTPPRVPTTVPDGTVIDRGSWDPNDSTFPAAPTRSSLYDITDAGTVDGVNFNAGDFIFSLVDSPSTTTFAGNWTTIDGGDSVHTWLGMTGVLTDAQVNAALVRRGYDRYSALNWDFDTGITTADPGSGNFALNNAAKASATIVTYNVVAASSARLDEVLVNRNIGDRILVQSQNDGNKWALYRITAAPVQTSLKVDFTVTNERAGGGEFTSLERINTRFFPGHLLPLPSLHNLAINIPSRVDLNTDLNNARTITFDVTNHSRLTALSLIVTTGDDKTLTLPLSDGGQSQSVTLSGIDTSAQGTVTFQLSGTYAQGTVTSNVVTINVQNLVANEQGYFGPRPSNDFPTVDLGLLTAVDVTTGGSSFDMVVSVPNGETLGLLLPQSRNATEILNTVSGRFAYKPSDPSVTPTFTLTTNVRTINSEAYDLLTTVNNSGFTATFSYRVTVEN